MKIGPRTAVSLLFACGGLLLATGCWRADAGRVVVYAALDQEFSKPLLETFSETSDFKAVGKYDVESTKTVGLTQAIIAEARNPRCDVFWNNEILNTLRLKRRGLLAALPPEIGKAFPPQYRDPEGFWFGFAARCRILIVNNDLVPETETPGSILDLTDPKWKGKVGIAKPLFGTTATHATVLFHTWGTERATQFFKEVKSNAKVQSGNKQVALAVARGQLAWGITDTDDANVELLKGQPVRIVYPDQGEGQLGSLFIPNTICVVKNCAHPNAANALVRYVLSPTVEEALARGPSAQIPLNPSVAVTAQVKTPRDVREMDVDFNAAVESWDTAAPILRDLFFSAE